MVVRALGSVTFFSFGQSQNVLPLMTSTPSGMTISVRLLAPLKALPSMVVTVEGRVMLAKLVAPEAKIPGMFSSFSGSMMVSKLVQLQKV